jgi:beta-carotene 3-hydroxylase
MFIFMELFSIFMHKYLQHGLLWVLHRDHHIYEEGRFEKNDAFSFMFSIISFLLIVTGIFSGFDFKFFLGIGMLFYGIGYFLYHDIVFHGRIQIRYEPNNRYLRRVLNAHAQHHQKSTANSGVSFGFFFVGKEYDVME